MDIWSTNHQRSGTFIRKTSWMNFHPLWNIVFLKMSGREPDRHNGWVAESMQTPAITSNQPSSWDLLVCGSKRRNDITDFEEVVRWYEDTLPNGVWSFGWSPEWNSKIGRFRGSGEINTYWDSNIMTWAAETQFGDKSEWTSYKYKRGSKMQILLIILIMVLLCSRSCFFKVQGKADRSNKEQERIHQDYAETMKDMNQGGSMKLKNRSNCDIFRPSMT